MAKTENKAKTSASTQIIVKKGDSGPATEDVQRKLSKLGYLKDSEVDSFYGDQTAAAVNKFAKDSGLAPIDDVSEKVWAKLVDASFELGDRNLYLRIPYFHGNDVLQLQKALGTLGFQINNYDGIFGTSTERALRRFQINMGLPSDGIVGSQTFMALKNLHFTLSDKEPLDKDKQVGANAVWRASEVLEKNSICIFGTDDFTKDVALRMSNLARATNPFSKILCSTAYSIAPDKNTMLLHLVLPEENDIEGVQAPRVLYDDSDEDSQELSGAFAKRLRSAISASKKLKPARLSIELPGKSWIDAGEDRSAQHFAITCLDALCIALEDNSRRKND